MNKLLLGISIALFTVGFYYFFASAWLSQWTIAEKYSSVGMLFTIYSALLFCVWETYRGGR